MMFSFLFDVDIANAKFPYLLPRKTEKFIYNIAIKKKKKTKN